MTAEPAASHPASTLVASYCFPPYTGTSAVAAAKRVRERGEPVDVIYNAMDGVRGVDPALLRLCGDLVQRFAAVPSPTHVSRWSDVTRFVQMGMDRALDWEQSRGSYSRLYSRAPYLASHILGAAFAAARPEVTWTAEFSGPLSVDAHGRVRRADVTHNVLSANLREAVDARGFHLRGDNVFEWAEVLPVVLADELLFPTTDHRDVMLERCRDPELAELVGAKARVAAHSALPGEFYHRVDRPDELDEHRRHIGYFGAVDRSLDTVLEALLALPESVRGRLVLHVFTTTVDEVRTHPQIRGLGNTVLVRSHPPYLEFLSLCTTMDCLLVTDATPPGAGARRLLPPQVEDHLASGTPVWGVVQPGSRLDMEPLAHRSPVDHVSAAAQVLAQLARA